MKKLLLIKNYKYFRAVLLLKIISSLAFAFTLFSGCENNENGFPTPIKFENIKIKGELEQRVLKNLSRLEGKRYQPLNVFLSEEQSNWWAGDTEGRTILALTLLEQSSKKEAQYLDEIILCIPQKLNNKGYLGTIWPDSIMFEQQLSGHGWFLRGLCEYYQWKRDEKVLDIIKTIVDSLVIPTTEYHLSYPLNPDDREHAGKYSGMKSKQIGNWVLSTDIGCDFVFLDGVVHAYEILRTEELKLVIENMIPQYLKMDLIKIKAQTHATLTGLRAILRYYEIINNPELLRNVIERYQTYIDEAITENYENYNWFGRPEWTEPCAIIDSYIVAVNLWKHTGNSKYLEDAHHIYYNAISHNQMSTGSFSVNTCSGADDTHVEIKIDDVYWCCNMRGGEGLSRAVEYSFFAQDEKIIIPVFQNCDANLIPRGNEIKISEKTDYPFGGNITISILDVKYENKIQAWELFNPTFEELKIVQYNDQQIEFESKNGMIIFSHQILKGDKITVQFTPILETKPTMNKKSIQKYFTFRYGPLILGHSGYGEIKISPTTKFNIVKTSNGLNFKTESEEIILKPLYHLLDPNVNVDNYSMQIMFEHEIK